MEKIRCYVSFPGALHMYVLLAKGVGEKVLRFLPAQRSLILKLNNH